MNTSDLAISLVGELVSGTERFLQEDRESVLLWLKCLGIPTDTDASRPVAEALLSKCSYELVKAVSADPDLHSLQNYQGWLSQYLKQSRSSLLVQSVTDLSFDEFLENGDRASIDAAIAAINDAKAVDSDCAGAVVEALLWRSPELRQLYSPELGHRGRAAERAVPVLPLDTEVSIE